LLGGGHTIGGGHIDNREVLHLSDFFEEGFFGESTHKVKIVWKGSSSELQVARVQYFSGIEKQGRRLHHAWAHMAFGTCIAA
jgi:hypothetical protein